MPLPRRHTRPFNDAVAIVTGAASGIGHALSCGLAARGAHVVMADVQPEVVEVAGRITCPGGVCGRVVDVRDAEAVRCLVEDTAQSHGRLDYLFNNAGIVVAGDAATFSCDDWKRVVDVNLTGVVNGVAAAFALMCRQGFGHIINTGSIAGLVPLPGTQIYCASKSAIITLTRCLRMEALPRGVNVSLICPGVVLTPMIHGGGVHGDIRVKLPYERLASLRWPLRPMSPERFARQALNAIARGKAFTVLPRWMTLLWWLDRLAPELVDWAGTAAYAAFARKLLKNRAQR